MFKNLEGARLGIFVFLGTALIFLSIFLVGNKDSLFVETITLKTYFSNIEGLRNGAAVRLSGMNVGTITSIDLVNNGKNNVEVTFTVQKSVVNFIRLDSEAAVETEGLVGAKILTIRPGNPDFEIVKEGGVIKSKTPMNMAEIVSQTTGIIEYTKNITRDFADIVKKINDGSGTIGQLVNDKELYANVVNITKTANNSLNKVNSKLDDLTGVVSDMSKGMNSVLGKLDASIADIQVVIKKVKNGEGFVGKLLNDDSPFDSVKVVINNLIKTTENTQRGTEALMENMEALKHNWMFKSYFEQRGYWSKSDYEKELDNKLQEIKKQNEELESRIKKLKELEKEADKVK